MKPVSITDLSPAEREYFKRLPGQSWLGDARILVTIKPVLLSQNTTKEILAVCDRAFDNVPRRLIGKAPLTHAVVYTDGSTNLLSQDEFRKLSLDNFVNAKELAEGVTSQ